MFLLGSGDGLRGYMSPAHMLHISSISHNSTSKEAQPNVSMATAPQLKSVLCSLTSLKDIIILCTTKILKKSIGAESSKQTV